MKVKTPVGDPSITSHGGIGGGVETTPTGAAKSNPIAAPKDGEKLQASTEKGLIDVPKTPEAAKPVALAARQVAAPFDSFMKVRTFEVDIQRPGIDAVQTVRVDILNGPGHNCSMAAPLMLDANGVPSCVLKAGDTRAARKLRGEDYVKLGMIGGRWDKVGADPKKIGLEEIAEEIGAQLVPGGYISLGDKLVPTMPGESTEADRYFAAIVKVDASSEGYGDMSGMEVVGLMKPTTMSVSDALKAMDDGSVGEGARARVAYQRALDAIGFVPELNAYVHDLPGSLKKRFDTLGLGDAMDPRKLADPPPAPAGEASTPVAADPKAAQVNDVEFVSQTHHAISDDAVMLDAKTVHVANVGGEAKQVGDAFPNQIYHLGYDRAKVVTFYNDSMQGPMVRLEATERPVMAAKALALDGERTYKDENTNLIAQDVMNLKFDIGDAKGGAITKIADEAVNFACGGAAKRLGAACDASPGQSDLRLHFFSNEVSTPTTKTDKEGFIPLSDAIALCRGGEGDAGTEALLLRLATDQGWIPSLKMTVGRASKLASG